MAREPDLTTAEACTEMNVSRNAVGKLIASGQLSTYFVGKQERITRTSLDEYKANNAYVPDPALLAKVAGDAA
ncbi:helix-turn-helix domain-containing protein [Ruegeria atlantica]|uniref:helix-turn-helix domain-containing protein n=1 Tax=Ruegeria atlantica TaxID=81569 RepID=UPI0024952B54|nr:helix-turn-helix domain-containing protein [Ruegeria atlantica]